jgi:hypothetical protein
MRPTHIGVCEPVLESGPVVAMYPELLPLRIKEHVEQSIFLLDIPLRQSSVLETASWTPCISR